MLKPSNVDRSRCEKNVHVCKQRHRAKALRLGAAALVAVVATVGVSPAKAEAQIIAQGLPPCNSPGLLNPVPPYCDPTPIPPPTLPSVKCGQPSTAGIGPIPYTDKFLAGTVVYGNGVVRPGTTIEFSILDQNNQVLRRHTTAPARENCVVHHEREAISTAGLAPGVYRVLAGIIPWENNNVTRVVRQFNLLEILPPPSTTPSPLPDPSPEPIDPCDGSARWCNPLEQL